MTVFSNVFTTVFVVALGISVLMQLWLALRQMRHVAAHRAHVPAHFHGRITLSAHQKAADYTVARTRLTIADTVVETIVLLLLTLGGGLAAIAMLVSTIGIGPLWQDVALTVSTLLLTSLVAL